MRVHVVRIIHIVRIASTVRVRTDLRMHTARIYDHDLTLRLFSMALRPLRPLPLPSPALRLPLGGPPRSPARPPPAPRSGPRRPRAPGTAGTAAPPGRRLGGCGGRSLPPPATRGEAPRGNGCRRICGSDLCRCAASPYAVERLISVAQIGEKSGSDRRISGPDLSASPRGE